MFVAYNLRRLMNIIDINLFTKFLAELVHLFLEKTSVEKTIQTKIKLFVYKTFYNPRFYKAA